MATSNFLSSDFYKAYEKYAQAMKIINVPAKPLDKFGPTEPITYWFNFDLEKFAAEALKLEQEQQKLSASLTQQNDAIKKKTDAKEIPTTIKYKVLNAPTTSSTKTLFKERLVEPSW